VLGLLHPCEIGEPGVPDCGASGPHDEAVLHPSYRERAMSGLGEDDRAGICFLYSRDDCDLYGCPLGYVCAASGCVADPAAGGCDAESDSAVCVGALGDPCIVDSECDTALCSGGGYCTIGCPDSVCPHGFDCARREGTCVARLGMYGDACSVGDVCASRMCVLYDGEGTCTRACDATAACPAGHACGDVESVNVCVPPAPVGGGCAVAAAHPPPDPLMCLVLGCWFAVSRVRSCARSRAKEKS
jgi:hypothetical protein